MNIFKTFRQNILTALHEMIDAEELPDNIPLTAITAEPPRDASHGDIATNAAMVVAKTAGKNPREIADSLAEKLQHMADVERAEVAGPGFINLHLKSTVWYHVVTEVIKQDTSYADSNIGQNEKVNVEYVSANPTGPMHIGHARGAVIGDVLASLLEKTGYDVTREYYVNDAGSQVDTLARSAYLRYREACGEDIGEIPDGLYPGDYLKLVGESFAKLNGEDFLEAEEAQWLPTLRDFALAHMIALIKDDLLTLGITHDVFISEKSLVDEGMVDNAIDLLKEKGLIYEGILDPPKGKQPEDWEPREQTLFQSTSFGDDVDRPLKKSDGTNTYFASDIAYHLNKMERGFNNMVLVLGADHGGYVKRMNAAVSALSNNKAEIHILLSQLVNFLEGGEPIKMSKRAGTFTTVRDVIHAVGKDVVRFIMLTRRNDATLDFDLQKVTEQSKDNPVFYVQYAHARAHSVFRKVVDEIPALAGLDYHTIGSDDLALLTHEQEIALIKFIAQWPRVVEAAAVTYEPHRIAFYLQELAASFHILWNLGNDDVNLRFIIPDDVNLTRARLALVKACTITVASGLHVLGVEPVMQM